MKKILALFLCFFLVSASAQNLPSGAIGTVNQTQTGVYQNFNYSFTAATTGIDYFGLAFRQDPGYWSVGNFSLTARGSTTNLLANPNLQYGGTTNTQYGLQAPADWGVWYQSSAGAPPAAGFWSAPGQGWYGSYTGGLGVNTSTAGSWIDGAVGTYDGIYQGFSATAGTTYNFSFTSLGTNPYSNPSIMIGVYAGSCAAGGTVFSCTPNAASGFTAAATPQQTQGTGGAPPPTNPSGPTVVSTSTSNQTATTVSYGTPTTSTSYTTRIVNTTNSAGNQVTYTYTDTVTTTTTPVYTTTTTTPVTTTTYSDGSTTTTDGTPTSSTVTTYQTSSSTSYASTPTSVAPWICCGGSSAQFNADSTKQARIYNWANRSTTDSQVYITQIGDSANITVNQVGSYRNYAGVNDTGSNNTISINQTANSNSVTNYNSTTVNGSSNTINVTQNGTGGAKASFINVANNNNSVTVTQTDTGNHWADISLTGGNKTVSVAQSGSAGQMASVQLSGNPTSLTLQQSGATQNFYSIQFNCATAGGCSPINVKQGN